MKRSSSINFFVPLIFLQFLLIFVGKSLHSEEKSVLHQNMEKTCKLDVIFKLLMAIKMLKKAKFIFRSILTGQTIVMSISDTEKPGGPGCACAQDISSENTFLCHAVTGTDHMSNPC